MSAAERSWRRESFASDNAPISCVAAVLARRSAASRRRFLSAESLSVFNLLPCQHPVSGWRRHKYVDIPLRKYKQRGTHFQKHPSSLCVQYQLSFRTDPLPPRQRTKISGSVQPQSKCSASRSSRSWKTSGVISYSPPDNDGRSHGVRFVVFATFGYHGKEGWSVVRPIAPHLPVEEPLLFMWLFTVTDSSPVRFNSGFLSSHLMRLRHSVGDHSA